RYRKWGKKLFRSIVEHSKVAGGYGSVEDVTVVPTKKMDEMQSFVMAETFKYLYLLFSPNEAFDLDRYVLNTEVQTTIFAEPGRMKNKAWKGLVGRHGFEFKPVHRHGMYEEPNDRAVKKHLGTLATNAATARVALITSDDDFVPDMRNIVLAGKEALICTSSKYYGLAQKYKQAGVLVVSLDSEKTITYKVRAVLESDGTGFVQRCCPIPHRSLPKEVGILREFMSSSGYMPTGREYLQSCIAKWCFTNSLGPITVYPATSCFLESYQFVTGGLARDAREDVAFFLPLGYAISGSLGRRKSIIDKYGSGRGWSVSHAGGPFILTPSSDLVSEALERLGFLDSHLNSDVSEAMLVFANISTNKMLLRKLEALPEDGERAEQLQHKFEQAFLSSRGSGQWQVAPSDSRLRATFARANRITDASASREEVFAVMQEYSKKKGLPRLKTYNGLAWQILRHMNRKDPSRRD
ncbi:MNS3, partial [Symbiodinium necroappetens]